MAQDTNIHKNQIIGVLSDTHGHLCKQAFVQLKGMDHIIHAGDIESTSVLSKLESVCQLTAILGNMDGYHMGRNLRKTDVAQIGGLFFYVLHDLSRLDLDPKVAGFAAIIHGHTHEPKIEWKNDVLYLNPGSVTRPRGNHGPSIAQIRIENGKLFPKIIKI